MKLLIMQPSPTSCHFITLRAKYSPQHPVLKHIQSVNMFHRLEVCPAVFSCVIYAESLIDYELRLVS
jgi:hypothetical protein